MKNTFFYAVAKEDILKLSQKRPLFALSRKILIPSEKVYLSYKRHSHLRFTSFRYRYISGIDIHNLHVDVTRICNVNHVHRDSINIFYENIALLFYLG